MDGNCSAQSHVASICKKQTFIPVRYVVTTMVSLGLLVEFALRFNLSVAIIAMVSVKDEAVETRQQECPVINHNSNQTFEMNMVKGEFNWSQSTQGYLQSAFFYGYMVTQLPGGRLAEVVDAKLLLTCALLLSSLFNMLIPIAARWHFSSLIVLRVLIGLAQGPSYPVFTLLLSRWSPKQERATILGIFLAGCGLGNIVTPVITTWLCQHGFAGGWPSVFYVFGIIGCVWCLLWLLTASSYPECHAWISTKELKYIQENRNCSKQISYSVPWRKMLTSMPVCCLVVAWFSFNWSLYMLLTELPSYMSTSLSLPLSLNGALNSIVNVPSTFGPPLLAILSDCIFRHSRMSLTALRKWFTTIGGSVTGLCLALIAPVGCNYIAVTAILAIAAMLQNSCVTILNAASVDIAPNYSGTVMGIANTFGTLSGILAPTVTGVITNNETTLYTWSITFYLAAALVFLGTVLFAIFGSAEPQQWALYDEHHNLPSNYGRENAGFDATYRKEDSSAQVSAKW